MRSRSSRIYVTAAHEKRESIFSMGTKGKSHWFFENYNFRKTNETFPSFPSKRFVPVFHERLLHALLGFVFESQRAGASCNFTPVKNWLIGRSEHARVNHVILFADNLRWCSDWPSASWPCKFISAEKLHRVLAQRAGTFSHSDTNNWASSLACLSVRSHNVL